jgi:hypothetical protein
LHINAAGGASHPDAWADQAWILRDPDLHDHHDRCTAAPALLPHGLTSLRLKSPLRAPPPIG